MPSKAIYEWFQENPEEEWWFFIAETLGRTVAEIKREMDFDELIRWTVYFARKAQNQELAMKAASHG